MRAEPEYPHAPFRKSDSGFSVVIPTFNEAANIGELLDRLEAAAGSAGRSFEVLFVDDSTDDTVRVIEEEAGRRGFPVRVVHRPSPENGLGGAVLLGLRSVATRWAVVMDADLQHPPEVVPLLLTAAVEGEADLVVATRYSGGGDAGGLSGWLRVLISRTTTVLCRLVFRRRLAAISDPMSGFFAVQTAMLADRALHPTGYKILLEIAVRCAPRRVAEVPYVFQPRFAGSSKASAAEGVRFLRHLTRLRFSAPRARLLAFGAIGVSGVVPNLVVLWLLTTAAGAPYLVAGIVANQAAVAWNFLLLDALLFHHRRSRHWSGRFGKFALVANADLLLRIPLLAVLVGSVHLGVLFATALTLVAAFWLRFLITDRAIYVPRPPKEPADTDAVAVAIDVA